MRRSLKKETAAFAAVSCLQYEKSGALFAPLLLALLFFLIVFLH